MMNVSQLANYYVNLSTFSATAASAMSAEGSSAKYAVTESTEDTVSISETSRKLNDLSSTLTEVRGLVELAAQSGASDELRSEISGRVSNLLSAIDEEIKNDDGSSLAGAVDLSSAATSKEALALIDEGLAAVESKRQELGIASSGGTVSTVTYSGSNRLSNLSEDEISSIISSLNSMAGGSNSQISILLSSISGNNNSALNGIYSLL